MQIILTHEHADAVLGLDEVWVVQPRNDRNEFEQIPIFLTQFTMDRFIFILCFPRISHQHKVSCNNSSRRFCSVVRRFPYLVEQKPEDGDEDAQAAKIDWKIIEEDVDKPFVASGLEFVPLPVTFSAAKLCFDLATCLPPRVVTELALLCSGNAWRGVYLFRLFIREESQSCIFI